MSNKRAVSIAIFGLYVGENRGMEFLEKLGSSIHDGDEKMVKSSATQEVKAEKKENIAHTESRITWKQHPKYAMFFRQVEVGVPVEAVKAKMSISGFDPSVME